MFFLIIVGRDSGLIIEFANWTNRVEQSAGGRFNELCRGQVLYENGPGTTLSGLGPPGVSSTASCGPQYIHIE